MKSYWWHLTPHRSSNANSAGRKHSKTGFVTAAETAELAGSVSVEAGWVLHPSRGGLSCRWLSKPCEAHPQVPSHNSPTHREQKISGVFNSDRCFRPQIRLHNAPHGPPLLDTPSELSGYFHSLCMKYHSSYVLTSLREE